MSGLAISIDAEMEVDEVRLPKFGNSPGVIITLRTPGANGDTAMSTKLSLDEAQTIVIGQRFRLRLEPK